MVLDTSYLMGIPSPGCLQRHLLLMVVSTHSHLQLVTAYACCNSLGFRQGCTSITVITSMLHVVVVQHELEYGVVCVSGSLAPVSAIHGYLQPPVSPACFQLTVAPAHF